MSDLPVVLPKIAKGEQYMLLPRGNPKSEETPFEMNVAYLSRAEVRTKEVAVVNAHTAPELLYVFTVAYGTAKKYDQYAQREVNEAEKAIARVRAVLLIDKVPEIMKGKNLRDSVDNREAIISADPEYQKLVDAKDVLVSIQKMMSLKAEIFLMNYNSVKKVLGGSSFPERPIRSGSIPEEAGPGDVIT